LRRLFLISFVALLFFCLGITIYSNILRSPFQFDDIEFIVENSSIRNIANLPLIWKFMPTRFVDFFSLALNYHFARLDVFSYHLVNIFLHLVVSLLVFWFVRLIFSTPAMQNERLVQYKNKIALFASLIFLVHTIQTESVTYIHQRSSCLAALFYLVTLCLYVTVRLWGIERKFPLQRRILFILSYITMLAGMFTRENVITLPLAILLFEFCFFGSGRQLKWQRLTPFLAALPVIPLTMFLTKPITLLHLQKLGDAPIKGWYYFLTQLNVKFTYLRLFLFPVKQNFDYDYPISRSLCELPTFVSLIALILILLLAVKMFRRYKLLSFSIFWFFLALLPESSFIPQPDAIFEHRLYLPLVGLCILLVYCVFYLFSQRNIKLAIVLFCIMGVILAYLTFKRNLVWRDEVSLWSDTITKSPDKARPYNERGNAYAREGNYIQAIADFDKAIEIASRMPENPLHVNSILARVYYNRAYIYQKVGSFERAMADYNRSLKINSANPRAYNNRAAIYAMKNEYDQAISDLSQAIQNDPHFILAYSNRAGLYLEREKYLEAISDFSKVIQMDPNLSQAYYGRAVAYLNMSNPQQAEPDFKKAMQLEASAGEKK